MRPVNLIPTEKRRGQHSPLRSGPLVYIFVGALIAALVAVTAVVLTESQISDRKAEVAQLEARIANTETRATELDAYTRFHEVREQRVATVATLANSRFDWESVMRQLSLILPSDVWLTNLTGTASPEVSVDGGGSVSLRASTPGPALEMLGCASSQKAVAGFVSALKEIDGVTRVGVQSSELPTGSSSGGSNSEGGSASVGDNCQTRDFIAQFQIVAAFDAAPTPAAAGVTVAPAAPETTSTPAPEG